MAQKAYTVKTVTFRTFDNYNEQNKKSVHLFRRLEGLGRTALLKLR